MIDFNEALHGNRIAVVIPALNEEETIVSVARGVESLDRDPSCRGSIYIIDGNSTDRTRDLAARNGWKVIVQKGKGKGAAVRQAVETIERDILVFIDADGSHEYADIPHLVAPLLNDEADIVVASRVRGGSDEFHGSLDNVVRSTGSALLSLGLVYRWNVGLTDIGNGFRAITRKAALALGLSSEGFTIEQEMVMKAIKKGYRVREIASHEYERKGGRSKNATLQGWKHIMRYLKDLW